MTICLTGDIHHMSMGTRDQTFLDQTELAVSVEYASIAAAYDIPVTLFVTGRAGKEEPQRVRRLASMENVEIGGHNYYAFRAPFFGRLPYGLCRKLLNVDAPAPIQGWEVGRTQSVLSELANQPIVSWRNHGYRHDRNTVDVLRSQGVTHYSDEVTPEKARPYDNSGLRHVPINVRPDHEHLYHGYRTESFVAEQNWEDAFSAESYHPGGWLDAVIADVERVLEQNGVATILAHPACMSIADGFAVFEDLCAFVSSYQTQNMREL